MSDSAVVMRGKRDGIKRAIRAYIRQEGLAVGDAIPSQNDFARMFEVTPLTIHRALTELANEQVIHRIKGKGSFLGSVPADAVNRPICLVLPRENLDQPEHNPTHWEYIQRLLQCFIRVAGEARVFSTLVIPKEHDPEEQIKRFKSGSIVFFLDPDVYLPIVRQFSEQNGLFAVIFSSPQPGLRCITASQNRVEGRRMGVHHLISLGYRKICFLGSDAGWEECDYRGYAQALDEAGLPCSPRRIVMKDETVQPELFVPELRSILDEGYDAICTGIDPLALQVIDFLRQEGVRVPGDIGVMGYDGLPGATQYPPYLTTIRPCYLEFMEEALARIENPAPTPAGLQHIDVSVEILPGHTVSRRA